MQIDSLYGARWFGLVDAAGVAVAFLLWWLVAARPSMARRVLALTGAGLLVLATGQAGSRIASLVTVAVVRTQRVGPVARYEALLAIAVAFGAWVWFSAGPEDDGAPVEPAAEPDGEPAVPVRRGSVVTLAAVAVGLALPVYGYLPQGFRPPSGLRPYEVTAGRIAGHFISGLVVGLALAGVALAYDRWEGSAVLAAFAFVAAGVAFGPAFRDAVLDGYWAFPAAGLTGVLLVAGTLRTLRRLPPVEPAAVAVAAPLVLGLTALRAAVFVHSTIGRF